VQPAAQAARPTAPPPIPPRRPRSSAPPTGAGLAGPGVSGGDGGGIDGGDGPPLISAPGHTLDFREVYEGHFDFVWRTVRRLGVHERWLDDAVQDVFIVVHRRLGEFEGRSTLKSWLFGIARRVAHDHRRRAGRKERGDSLPDGLIDPQAASPADDLQRARALQVLHEILETLDDDKREVFILAELEQMTVPEIAAATDANLNTVYSRLRAARQAFDAAVSRHQARARRSP
jgi:RNA polymerase sigma-70 factor (ECF subfamily)